MTAWEWTADRVPRPGGIVRDTDRRSSSTATVRRASGAPAAALTLHVRELVFCGIMDDMYRLGNLPAPMFGLGWRVRRA